MYWATLGDFRTTCGATWKNLSGHTEFLYRRCFVLFFFFQDGGLKWTIHVCDILGYRNCCGVENSYAVLLGYLPRMPQICFVGLQRSVRQESPELWQSGNWLFKKNVYVASHTWLTRLGPLRFLLVFAQRGLEGHRFDSIEVVKEKLWDSKTDAMKEIHYGCTKPSSVTPQSVCNSQRVRNTHIEKHITQAHLRAVIRWELLGTIAHSGRQRNVELRVDRCIIRLKSET